MNEGRMDLHFANSLTNIKLLRPLISKVYPRKPRPVRDYQRNQTTESRRTFQKYVHKAKKRTRKGDFRLQVIFQTSGFLLQI